MIQEGGDVYKSQYTFNNFRKIDKIENNQNRLLVKQYHKFTDSTEASERHQNNNLKVILSYINY